MLSKEQAKEEIRKLIEAYNSRLVEYERSSEQDIRIKLIDKLFKRLGWDLDGDEDPDEVQREEGIKNEESKKKKADYVFRLNSVPKLIVEAKGIKGVNMNDEQWREQSVGYAYNLACQWAVLTNFKTTIVYYVDANEDTSIRRIYDLGNLDEFDKNFDSLWLLSKESIKADLLLKEVDKLGIKQRKEKVGNQLFQDLSSWRKKLSDNIRKRYSMKYKGYEIEEIVQKIIDRLIFIRKLEDLEIEERKLEQLIRKLSDKTNYYSELKNIFIYYHNKYNSGLFGEDGVIQECDQLDLDNEPIREVILGMYKPRGLKIEYNFAAIDADVLGNIYEQYLSFILKDTSKKTKLEGGRTHRKEQGIYYTPTYVVDYIIKDTLGVYIKNKEIDEILKTKIIDPACGSGSFLIRAFNELCKAIEEKMKKGKRSTKSASFKEFSSDNKLNLHQKIAVLTGCIYGVDLDKKAVEIAQLNLLLKLLEGETAESLKHLGQTKKLLPMLSNNVKNGNSLIDDCAFDNNCCFKWEEEFKDIISYDKKNNLEEGYGFDVVVGNPPYFNIRTNLNLQEFCKKRYPEIYNGQNDILYYFFLKGINILKETGYLGFIVSRYYLEAESAKKIREFMLSQTEIKDIIDFGNNQIFEGANVLATVQIMKKNTDKIKRNNIKITKFKTLEKINIKENLLKNNSELVEIISKKQNELSSEIWAFYNEKFEKIIGKIEENSFPLSKIAKTGAGIQSGLNEVFVVNEEIIKKFNLEKDILRNYVKTRDIKPFSINSRDLKVIKLLSTDKIDNYPNAKKYLLEYQSALKNRYEFKKGICEWFAFSVPRNLDIYESNKEKIITPIYSTSNKFGYDSANSEQNFLTLSDTAVIQINDDNYLTKSILAILNSNLMNFYYKKTRKLKRDNYYEYLSKTIESLPLKYSESFSSSVNPLVDTILHKGKQIYELGEKKTEEIFKLKNNLDVIKEKLDEEVYKLYKITKEEQKIIEDSLK